MPNPIETQHTHLTKANQASQLYRYLHCSFKSPAWCYCNELNDSSGESMQTKMRLLKEQYNESFQCLHLLEAYIMVKPQILRCLCPKNAFSNLKIFFFSGLNHVKTFGLKFKGVYSQEIGCSSFL